MSLAQIPSRHRPSTEDQWPIVKEPNLDMFFSPGLVNLLGKFKKTIEKHSLAPSVLITMSAEIVLSAFVLRPTDQSNKQDNRIALSESLAGVCLVPNMTNVFCTVAINPDDTSKRTYLVNYSFPDGQTMTAAFPYKIVFDNDSPVVKWNESEFALDDSDNEINEILGTFQVFKRSDPLELAASMRQLITLGHKLFFAPEAIEEAIAFSLVTKNISANVRVGDKEKKDKEQEFYALSESLYGSIILSEIDLFRDFLTNHTGTLEALESYIEDRILTPSFFHDNL